MAQTPQSALVCGSQILGIKKGLQECGGGNAALKHSEKEVNATRFVCVFYCSNTKSGRHCM